MYTNYYTENMKNILFNLSILLISFLSVAQKPVDVKLYLRDGNTMTGTTSLNDVVLKTNYGQLVIPIQNVTSVTIGLGKDKAITDKAISYLKILNSSSSEDMKKAAYTDLVKLGVKAISAINDFQSDSKNYSEIEISGDYTIDNALSELKNTNNIDDVTKIQDIVTIDNEYTMGGTYDFVKIDIKTEYGNLSVPKEKIKNIEITYSITGSEGDVNLKLLANKHISGNQNGGWLKTGINLKKGQKFTINASGEVTLASLSNQKYKPDGSYIATNGTTYPSVSGDYSDAGTTYPVYGNVVYKIGDASYDILKAGAKYTGIAKESGMLYLSIYETVYNSANTGAYNVKISLK